MIARMPNVVSTWKASTVGPSVPRRPNSKANRFAIGASSIAQRERNARPERMPTASPVANMESAPAVVIGPRGMAWATSSPAMAATPATTVAPARRSVQTSPTRRIRCRRTIDSWAR
jgi:hypothetical protein